MNLKFSDAYIQYLNYVEIRQKKQSIRTLKEKFENHLLPYWEDYNIYEISIDDYLVWQSYFLKKNYRYSYNQKMHYLMSGFFNYCVSFLNLKHNVCRQVGCFKKDLTSNIKYNFYTHKDFKKFIKQFDYKDYVYKVFFSFMYYTGVRPGEVMALNFNDLNNGVITINKTIDEHFDEVTKVREIGTPKTLSSYRTIRIDFILECQLQKLKKYYISIYENFNDDYFIFGGIKPLAPTTLNRKKSLYSEKAKVKKIKLHEFRHSHATLLFDKGISIHEISKRLGHRDIAMTLNTYIHSSFRQEKRVLRVLNFLRLI